MTKSYKSIILLTMDNIDKKVIYLACSADENYAPRITAMLVSLLENIDKNYLADIKILDGGISGESKGRISVSLGHYNCVFEFVSVGPEKSHEFEKAVGYGSHLSAAAYSRLLLPEIFPEIEKIIYLDGDLAVRGDLSRLWETDLGGRSVVAAPVLFSFYYDLLFEIFQISKDNGYFNSGVMVMDLAKMRAQDFSRRAIDFISDNRNKLTNVADQDVLNALLFDDFKKLDLKWNQMMESYIGRGYENTAAARYGFYSKEEFLSAKNNPQIVHFDGAFKPWHLGFFHPFKKLYGEYAAKTEFRNLKKQFDAQKLFSFYAYYSLRFLPPFIYQLILPILKKIYKRKNFRPLNRHSGESRNLGC